MSGECDDQFFVEGVEGTAHVVQQLQHAQQGVIMRRHQGRGQNAACLIAGHLVDARVPPWVGPGIGDVDQRAMPRGIARDAMLQLLPQLWDLQVHGEHRDEFLCHSVILVQRGTLAGQCLAGLGGDRVEDALEIDLGGQPARHLQQAVQRRHPLPDGFDRFIGSSGGGRVHGATVSGGLRRAKANGTFDSDRKPAPPHLRPRLNGEAWPHYAAISATRPAAMRDSSSVGCVGLGRPFLPHLMRPCSSRWPSAPHSAEARCRMHKSLHAGRSTKYVAGPGRRTPVARGWIGDDSQVPCFRPSGAEFGCTYQCPSVPQIIALRPLVRRATPGEPR